MDSKSGGWLEVWRVPKLKKVIGRWVNFLLQDRYFQVTDLEKDFADSMVLVNLMTVVLQENVYNGSERIHRAPKRRGNALRNIQICMDMFKNRQGMPVLCRPEEMLDGSVERILLFMLQISRYYYATKMTPPAKCVESAFRGAVLDTVKKRVMGFKDPKVQPETINNFTSCFEDGLVFGAILYTEDQTLFSWDTFKTMSAHDAILNVFTLVERHYGLPQLLDAADVVNSSDEYCIILYVAAMLHSFRRRLLVDTDSAARIAALEDMAQNRHLAAQSAETALRAEQLRNEELVKKQDSLNIELYDIESKRQADVLRLAQMEAQNQLLSAQLFSTTQVTTTADERCAELKSEMDQLVRKNVQTEAALVAAIQEANSLKHDMGTLNKKMDFTANDRREASLSLMQEERPAPTGMVTIMFTEVENSAALWDHNPDVMAEALTVHNQQMRELLFKYNGYEVKTEGSGDAFMVAFGYPLQAVKCAIAIQKTLLDAPWPRELLAMPEAAEEKDPNDSRLNLRRGYRISIGLNQGVPARNVVDPVTGRMDYFGPVVNIAHRIKSAAHGGQILITRSVVDAVEDHVQELRLLPPKLLGNFDLKGLRQPVDLYELTPIDLRGRIFDAVLTDFVHPDYNQIGAELELVKQTGDDLIKRLAQLQSSNLESASAITELVTRLQIIERTPGGASRWEAEKSELKTQLRLLKDVFDKQHSEMGATVSSVSDLKSQVLNMDVQFVTIRKMLSVEARKNRAPAAEFVARFIDNARTKEAWREERAKLRQEYLNVAGKLADAESRLAFHERNQKRVASSLGRADDDVDYRPPMSESTPVIPSFFDDDDETKPTFASETVTGIESAAASTSPALSRSWRDSPEHLPIISVQTWRNSPSAHPSKAASIHKPSRRRFSSNSLIPHMPGETPPPLEKLKPLKSPHSSPLSPSRSPTTSLRVL